MAKSRKYSAHKHKRGGKKHTRRHNKKHGKKHNKTHNKQSKHRSKSSRKHTRRHRRKSMKGGVKYVSSNADFSKVNETVPYKVGAGIPAGKGSLPTAGRNHYALNQYKPDITRNIMNTSLHTSVPETFLNGQSGGGGLTKLMPQDLVNLGRSIIGGAETLYDNWTGSQPPVSSSVMVQPINNLESLDPTLIDMNKVELRADHRAASAE